MRQPNDEGRGPGAHSGHEDEAHDRVVPGTASAAEGYTESATAQGDPLRGVQVGEGDAEDLPEESAEEKG
ncbi:hypothetical protein [Streptomyces sp. RFCAC02]|uniref:hypothetical protein n=1 Tax=Streptomyces sp. RFCAC02 TaxID=2499143 RepID=UPI0010226C1C|nr:hypothetical protein [Streptomyces sp. RFCAC02]